MSHEHAGGIIPYRAHVDGLRAVAVIPVILFHMGVGRVAGGFLGVDVFFVISGYLITSIIIREYENSTFSFAQFWLRRIRRIFPALMTMLLVTTLATLLVSFRGDTIDFGVQGAAAALSLANVAMWRLTGDYWGGDANNSPFLHTWSLSVEEQFYLIYPFLLVGLLRFARARMHAVLALGVLGSFVLYVIGAWRFPVATFYLLPTRAWELGCGCLLAASTRQRQIEIPKPLASFLSLAGLLAVVGSYLLFSEQQSFPGYLAIPVVGAAFVIALGDGGTLVGKLLSLPPIVWIGRMSYSLYLWHWPILIIGKQAHLMHEGVPRVRYVALLIPVVAWISYRYVENLTRFRLAAPVALRLSAALLVASLTASLYVHVSPHDYDASSYAPVIWSGNLYNVSPVIPWDNRVQRRMAGVVAPTIPRGDFYASGGVIKHHGGETPEVVVLGDSHALMWSASIDRVCRELGKTVSFYAADGADPFVALPLRKSGATHYFTADQRYRFDRKRLEYVEKWKPKVVVLATRWSSYLASDAEDLVEFLGNAGATVLLMQQPPELYFGDKNAVQYLSSLGLTPKDGVRQCVRASDTDDYTRGLRAVDALCRKHPFCRPIRVLDIFRVGESANWVLDGSHVLYLDDDHLSEDGAKQVEGRIRAGLQAALQRPDHRLDRLSLRGR